MVHLKVQLQYHEYVSMVCGVHQSLRKGWITREGGVDRTGEMRRTHQEDVLHALYGCPKLEDLWNRKPQWYPHSLRQADSFIDLLGTIFAENKDSELFC